MASIPRLLSSAWGLALAGGFLAAGCAESDSPSGSVAYYRSHAAEWERAVWVCTNDGSALEHTIGCANALHLLDERSVEVARRHLAASSANSPASMARD